jgi:DNA polymerase III epsilon subunit-like protein
MISNNTIIVYDYETSSRYPNTTQPIQLSAVAIHGQRLEVIEGSEFDSLIRPIEDPELQAKAGLGAIEDEALAVNRKTIEELRLAPDLKTVWTQFIEYTNNFNYKKNSYTAPIVAGYNIIGFDNIITDRICGPHGWGYGPWDKDRQKNSLFNPIYKIDLMDLVFTWFSSTAEPRKLNLGCLMEFLGMDTAGAHDGLVDCKNTANILCRFLKMQRELNTRIKWNPNL